MNNKKIDIIIGTAYFVSYHSAIKYYRGQWSGQTDNDIQNKIDNKEIFIGKPKIDKNQTLSINDGRYHIITYKD